MTDDNQTNKETTFGQRMRLAAGAFLRALLRLFVITLILGGLAVVFIYGARQVNSYYERTQQSIQQLQDVQANHKESIRQLSETIDGLKERVNAIEIQNDSQKQVISEIEGQISDLQKQQTSSFQDLESAQSESQAGQEKLGERLEQLAGELESLSSQVEQSDEQLEQLDEQLTALKQDLETGDVSVVVLQRELELVKAMELLTRSRLFLIENNLGLAQDDIQSARDLLADLVVADFQQETLDEIIQRLDLALEYLPESPILAAEDLEIAWQLLKNGLPETPSEETAEQPTATPEATLTEPLVDDTPTPTPTPNP